MALIPYDDRDGFIWLNGQLVEWREAQVHVLSHGLHYASSIFEGERAYGGRIFKSREHTERFFQSAKIMDMPMPFTIDQIEAAKKDVLKANGIADGYVRPVAWRGSEMMAVAAQHATTHVAIATWPWPNLFGDDAAKTGISLTMAPYRRPAPDMAPVHAKAAGLYMICTLSKHQAESKGFNDALMLDYRGQLAEATGANVFLVRDGVIHTPTPDCFLDGITRRTVMDIARAKGYEVVQRAIWPEEIFTADEMFLSGTAAEVMPVGRVDDHAFNQREVGLELRSAYLELVNSPTGTLAGVTAEEPQIVAAE